MAMSEENFSNYKHIISYLDTMREKGCMLFQQTQPVPVEFQLSPLVEVASDFFEFGNENYNEGDFSKALRSFTRGIKLYSYIGGTGIIPLVGGEVRETSDIRIRQTLARLYFNRGNTYDELGKQQEAIADYNGALTLGNPEPWHVLNNRAHVYEKLNQLGKAEQDLLEALRIAPEHISNIESALIRVRSNKEHRGCLSRLFGR